MKSKEETIRTVIFRTRSGDIAFDLPKSMPLPERGSKIFYNSFRGIVKDINFSINGKSYSITIYVDEEIPFISFV